MATLVGLGAALETPPLPLVAPSLAASRAASPNGNGASTHGGAKSDGTLIDGSERDGSERGAARSSPRNRGLPLEGSRLSRSSASNGGGATNPSHHLQPSERAPFDALNAPTDVEASHDISAWVRVLADFALKLSLGPLSHAWFSHVRRSAVALLSIGKHRHETALAALSARLLALLPSQDPALGEPASLEAESLEKGRTIDGEQRGQILHELARLAGVLPEWPAAAQDLAEEARRRETRIMRELLTVVDGFKRDQRARLEEQMRLEDLAQMAASMIAEEFEAPLERAAELSLVLENYRRERRTCVPDVGNMVALGRALDDLSRVSREFDECDSERKDSQRVLRLERRQALTSVTLLLAERGELELLDQLEPLSISERVERLQQWFESVRCEGLASDNAQLEGSRLDKPRVEPAPFERPRFESTRLEGGLLESGSERTT
jgi:hypothetical protein